MAQVHDNTTLEMGTSDQALIAATRKKNIAYIAGAVAMLVAAGLLIALVVVLTTSDDPAETTTEGTTEGTTTTTTTTSTTTTTTTTTTPAPEPEPTPEPPPTLPPDQQIPIEDINGGSFTPNPFNGSWVSGREILYKNPDLELLLYDMESGDRTVLVGNTSVPLRESSRFTEIAPDRSHVVYSYNVAPIYRHSFLARYSLVDYVNGVESDITPPSLADTELPLLQNFLWGVSGSAFAYVYQNNIYYQSDVTSTPQQITTNGQINVIYNGIPDWVYEEEVFSSHNAIWFSPDGSRMAYATFDDTHVRVMKVPHFGEPGNPAYQYTVHNEIHYPKPGTVNPTVSVTIVDLSATPDSPTVITQPADLTQPILRNVRFINANTVAVMWTNRVQTMFVVELCTQATTPCNRVYTYNQIGGWIDNIPMIFNNDGNAFITILPRPVDDIVIRQVVQVTNPGNNLAWAVTDRTNTGHAVFEILHWSPENTIWYKANHVNDSAQQHIYSVNSAGDISCFTCGIVLEDGRECLYNDGSVATDGTTVTVNCAGPGVPKILIYSVNGDLLRVWEENAGIEEKVSQRYIPEIIRWQVQVAPGFPAADVHIQVPINVTDRVNVPLLVYVYGGPDTALVTKQFSIDWGTSLVTRWNIAVAHIDGRGSNLRGGVSNTFAINRRLGTDEIDDQISVTRHLQEHLPFLDANRTCIWGWSYGGYAASLALARGGSVFRCAAAVAPVVDWRFYDTIYTERYMDEPQDNVQGYTSSSLLSDDVVAAYRDKRYCLIHGTADDNVHYQHAMLLSRRLQREDVAFTQMSYTDEDHSLAGVRPHLYHALEKFLSEHML